jgi:hypothetical protein
MVIGIVALLIGILMILLAKRMSGEKQKIAVSYVIFMFLYLPLYTYWWASAIHARATNKNVVWRGRKREEKEIRYA